MVNMSLEESDNSKEWLALLASTIFVAAELAVEFVDVDRSKRMEFEDEGKGCCSLIDDVIQSAM